jgi:hypothetical protein
VEVAVELAAGVVVTLEVAIGVEVALGRAAGVVVTVAVGV